MRVIVIFILIFISYTGHGQQVTISSSIDLGHNTRYKILGSAGSYNILFVDRNNQFELHVFDKNLKKIRSRVLQESSRDNLVSGIFVAGENIEFFYSRRTRDTTYLIHKTYNNKVELLDSTIILKDDKRNHEPYFFAHSEDKSKVLLFRALSRTQIKMLSFDLVGERVLWQRVFYFDNKFDREFQFVEITNTGSIFLTLDKHNTRLKSSDHKLIVYQYNGGKDFITWSIDFEGKLNYRLTGKYDNLNKTLVIGGFYSERNFSLASGIYLFKIDEKTGKTHSFFNEFDYRTLQNIENQRGKKIEGIQDLEIADLLLTNSGGAVLLGEIQKEYFTRMNYSSRYSPGINNNIDYYMEDIIAFAVSEENTMAWTRVIHKRQFSQDDQALYSSFFTFKVPSFVELIFNDEISSNSTVSAFGLDGNGDVNRINLMSTGLQNLRIRFNRSVQVSSNSFLAPSDYRNELKLVLIEF